MLDTLLNAHPLFCGATTDKPFLERLNPTEARIRALRTARDAIRKAITTGFANWQSIVEAKSVVEKGYLRAGNAAPKLRPKFRRQGSYAYATLNSPAYADQQIDFDDGMFLPVSFFTSNGHRSPALTSEGYFLLVERCLEKVCRDNGWTLVRKDCCIRVQLDSRSHIDIALYAIPDAEYETLLEKAARSESIPELAFDSFPEEAYERLEPDTIMLAQRSTGWTESDPRAIEDWFVAACKTHGEQLRRVCRYLKAWRDWTRLSRLSSITLMKCAVDVFDSLRGRFENSRDDAALLLVASHLAGFFSDLKGITNPVIEKPLNDGWTEEQRTTFVSAARALESSLSEAIQKTTDKNLSLNRFVERFGTRIPGDPDLIVAVSGEVIVRSYTPRRTPSPQVVRTRSG